MKKVQNKSIAKHLYIRGDFFYYRLRIPKKYNLLLDSKEIRFSLKTDSYREAKRNVAFITGYLEYLFQEEGMTKKSFLEQLKACINQPDRIIDTKPVQYDSTVVKIHDWLQKHNFDYTIKEVHTTFTCHYPPISLPNFDSDKLSTLLNENTVEMPYDIISRRLVGYFKFELQADSLNPDSRTLYEKRELSESLLTLNTPQKMGITANVVYTTVIDLYTSCIDNPPLLCLHAIDIIETLIERKVFQAGEFSYKNHISIVNEYYKNYVEFLSIAQARLRKDYSREKLFFTQPYIPYPQETLAHQENIFTRQQEENIENTSKLSSYLEHYLKTKVDDGKKDKRYIPDLQKKLELFIKITGDKDLASYSRTDFRNFRDTLKKLPPNFSKYKALRDKSIAELLEMNYKQVLQPETINGYLVAVSSLFNWFVTEGLLTQSFANDLSIKNEQAEIDAREPFSPDDLRLLFKHNDFIKFKESTKPSRYWSPWIALYTGMRLEEICQLMCSDIYKDDGLWVIDINDKKSPQNEKHLKTKNAVRIIPIHSHLLQLGFLDYVTTTKKMHQQLFPELTPIGNRKQYGKMVGKDFGILVRKIGIQGKKSFHSFRHTFSDFFKKKQLHNDIFEQIFGHTHTKLATRRYGERFSTHDCYEKIIRLLDYGLE